jgi:hypothetical protein
VRASIGRASAGRRAAAVNIVAAATTTLAFLSTDASEALADQYEATVALRPTSAMARVTEDVGMASGAPLARTARGGGGELALSVGVRNWLDVEGDLVGAAFEPVTYNSATAMITGTPETGRLVRATRVAQLRVGVTLRQGVVWIPTVHVGIGIGARLLSAADLHFMDSGRQLDVTPDGMDTSLPLDFVVLARLGFERRLGRRWTVGAFAEAAHSVGISAPPLDIISANLSISYSWYPRLW